MKEMLALMLLAASPLLAFEGGLKGGINLSRAVGSGFEDESHASGPVAGAFLSSSNPRLSLQFEALYSQKGTSEEGLIRVGATDYSFHLTYDFDYLEMPLLLKYRFGPNHPRVLAGASLGILLDASVEGEIEGIPVDLGLRSRFNDTDLSVLAGIEVMASARIAFEVRYTRGLLPLLSTPSEADACNSTISVLLGYYVK